jgi:Ni,Fe-hydrogenase III small subunit
MGRVETGAVFQVDLEISLLISPHVDEERMPLNKLCMRLSSELELINLLG